MGLALLLVLLAFGGMEAWTLVHQARTALPGDDLYPVKQTAEQAALALTFNVGDRAQRHADLLRARENEIVNLTLAGRYENIPSAVQDLRAEIDKAAEAFRVVAEQNQAQGLALVDQTELSLNNNAQLLAALALAGPPGAQPILRSAIETSLAGVSVLRAQMPSSARAALELTAPAPTLPAVAASALASDTPTLTPTASATATFTRTATVTPNPTASNSPTGTATVTIRPIPVATLTPTPSQPPPSATNNVNPPGPTATPVPPTPTQVPPTATQALPTSTDVPPPTQPPDPTQTPRPTEPPKPTHKPKPTHTNGSGI